MKAELQRLKEKARGQNSIGAWGLYSVNVCGFEIGPRDLLEGQSALIKRADLDLGANNLLVGLAMTNFDDSIPSVQITMRFQAFAVSFERPTTATTAAVVAILNQSGKTRMISLDE